MEIEIHDEPLSFDLYGLSGDVPNHDYAGTGMKLMNELWPRVKNNGLPHKGINFWVYDCSTSMFTGVELSDASNVGDLLEHKLVNLPRYAYYKHIGPYNKLGDTHRAFEREMMARGLTEIGPRVERYGNWVEDESKLVTEIFIGVK
jgi:effector-binding domain-containing protein